LLPQGVGKAVRNAPSPKVYIPNTGHDPEQLGHTVASCVAQLLATLRRDAGEETTAAELLDLVLVDSANGDYPGGLEAEAVRSLGVTLVDLPLVTPESRPHLDPELLARALLSLA
ncbi:MAG TPA: GAK system CofD-like protein, partial [Candidatus Krumholzibacteria bacterium]|nr:GAK system CofD-like protein [Candidatus Krumholzibacteria bacterium]